MKIPAVGVATAVFGVVLIAGAWLYTIERVRSERAEAVTSEFSKNANLALALDVQTSLVMKSQYERPSRRRAPPARASPSSSPNRSRPRGC